MGTTESQTNFGKGDVGMNNRERSFVERAIYLLERNHKDEENLANAFIKELVDDRKRDAIRILKKLISEDRP